MVVEGVVVTRDSLSIRCTLASIGCKLAAVTLVATDTKFFEKEMETSAAASARNADEIGASCLRSTVFTTGADPLERLLSCPFLAA